jgi:hydrogenase maturation protease
MIRVVGIGSPFGDDQAGWQVVERLRGRLPAGVELLALDRPGAALVNRMRDADWFILVDALEPRGTPGRVCRVDPEALPPGRRLSSHELALDETLRLADALGCRPPRLDVYGIEIAGLESDAPCDAVTAGAIRLADRLVEELRTIAGQPAAG